MLARWCPGALPLLLMLLPGRGGLGRVVGAGRGGGDGALEIDTQKECRIQFLLSKRRIYFLTIIELMYNRLLESTFLYI